TVISPMVGTPAHEAGVLAGDVILKIDGKSTENLRMNEAIDLITGDPGDKITLTVRHEDGDVETLSMKRAEIKVPSVMGDLRKADNVKEWDYLIDREQKIGYLRLIEFKQTSTAEMKAALEEMTKEK